ncbi:response regulator [Streptomyces sp. MUM 178J]|uniref:response regulator n=1 Tax=Streptomyces sp. MUM 178J TaxID=2791991 RepID=UPI001F039953|nr:response regulator transcription factor [Streptomyces sp. MUM 178J]WRQ78132.1 response regulator transcription factor [Streptomyces sp. MUM 178J]
MITIAVVDDDRMLLEGLRSWMLDVPEVRLAAAAATVDELLGQDTADAGGAGAARAAADGAGTADGEGERERDAFDVVLLDLVLRDGSQPPENIRRLRAAGSRVLIISTVADRGRIVAAIAAGADGYLTKDHDLDTLVTALQDVAAGRSAHSPELAFALAHDQRPDRPRLSPKELQVLLDYASGLTLKSTARRAGITPNTAKYYLDRVKDKYQQAGRPAYTKIDLALRVREDGLDAS